MGSLMYSRSLVKMLNKDLGDSKSLPPPRRPTATAGSVRKPQNGEKGHFMLSQWTIPFQ